MRGSFRGLITFMSDPENRIRGSRFSKITDFINLESLKHNRLKSLMRLNNPNTHLIEKILILLNQKGNSQLLNPLHDFDMHICCISKALHSYIYHNLPILSIETAVFKLKSRFLSNYDESLTETSFLNYLVKVVDKDERLF